MTDHYFQNALEMREKLNAVSPNFCLAKWLHVSLHLPTGTTSSCYHPRPHSIPLRELEKDVGALHNTHFKKAQRKLMLEGKAPEECHYCWKIESLNGAPLSDRSYRSAEEWAAPRFEEIARLPWDQDVYPAYLEVNFNHACQFKCSYCSPQLSSAWMGEILQHGPYPTTWKQGNLEWLEKQGLLPIANQNQNPYIEAFWKWWPLAYPHLRVFRMTGGEPLLDENSFRIFQYTLDNPHPNLSLNITSNFCPPERNFDRFLAAATELVKSKSVGDFRAYVSLDAIGEQGEYIRNGLNFANLQTNIHRYLAADENLKLSFILTLNNLSVAGLTGYFDWLGALRAQYSKKEQRIFFDAPFLTKPEFMSLQILSPDWKAKLNSAVQYARGKTLFSRDELAKLERSVAWAELPLPSPELKQHRRDFFDFFNEHDRRRKTDFRRAFPEMQDFWQLCASCRDE